MVGRIGVLELRALVVQELGAGEGDGGEGICGVDKRKARVHGSLTRIRWRLLAVFRGDVRLEQEAAGRDAHAVAIARGGEFRRPALRVQRVRAHRLIEWAAEMHVRAAVEDSRRIPPGRLIQLPLPLHGLRVAVGAARLVEGGDLDRLDATEPARRPAGEIGAVEGPHRKRDNHREVREAPLRELVLCGLEVRGQVKLGALQVVGEVRPDIVSLIGREVLGAAGGRVLVALLLCGRVVRGAGHGAFGFRGWG